MMNTATSGVIVVISFVPSAGQSTKLGFARPLDTREWKYGWTTPVAPASVPSAGPSEPASESPPIHSLSGSALVRLARHGSVATVVDVGLDGVRVPLGASMVSASDGRSSPPKRT